MIISCSEERDQLGKKIAELSLDEFINQLPYGVTLVDFPYYEKSCESYALGNNGKLKDEIFDHFCRVNEGKEKEGDIVVYTDHFGDVQHVGIYEKDGMVISKWGETGPVLKHPVGLVPKSYGEIVFFLRQFQRE